MTTLSIGQLVNRLALATLHVQEAEYILSRGKAMVEEYQARLNADIAVRDDAHKTIVNRVLMLNDFSIDSNSHPAITINPENREVFIDYTRLLDRAEE